MKIMEQVSAIHSFITLIVVVCFFGPAVSAQETEWDRWLGLDGASNARDAGGYQTESGAWMKRGVLYRSNRLYSATARDCETLKALGLRTDIDLRTKSDADTIPDAPCVMEFARFLNFPIGIEGATWEAIYFNIVNTYSASIAQSFQTIADPENLPLLYHCTAGKDRAGTLTALIHLLLGVSEDDLMADYMLSLQVGYQVNETWLQVVLDLVKEEGGIETFLLNRGVGLETQQAVRDNLLETAVSVREWMILDSESFENTFSSIQ